MEGENSRTTAGAGGTGTHSWIHTHRTDVGIVSVGDSCGVLHSFTHRLVNWDDGIRQLSGAGYIPTGLVLA